MNKVNNKYISNFKMIYDERYVRNTSDLLVPAHTHYGKYLLDKLRKVDGDKIALIDADTGEKLTYKEVRQYAVNLAMALTSFGVQKGDVVALGCDTRCTFLPISLGIFLSGATYTPYRTESRNVTINIMKIAKPKYLLSSKLFWENHKDEIATLEFINKVIFLDDDTAESGAFLSKLMTNNYDADKFEPNEVKGQEDTAMIIYTSGSTGFPKAIELSHINCIINSTGTGIIDDSIRTVFFYGKWYFSYEYFLSNKILTYGKKIVFHRETTPDSFIECIENFEVNALFGYSKSIFWLANAKKNYNLSSLVYIWSAAAPLCPSIAEKVKQRYPSVKGVFQTYGLTEIWLTFEGLRRDKMKRGSVGPLMPGAIIKVMDPNTKKLCGSFEKGEVCGGGPRLFKGYIGVDKSSYLDEEGFLKTGDIGYYDDEGYLFIVGRMKEIFKCGGIQIPPAHIEMVLEQYPGVAKAAVVGKPDLELQYLATAFVVLEPGATVTEDEIMKYTNKELPDYMQLKGGVIFADEIPKCSRGKINRKKLEEMLP